MTADPRICLAAALLIHTGEISIDEIEALPFVDTREVAEIIASELTKWLGAERCPKVTQSGLMPIFEDIMRLPKSERSVL